MGKTWVVVGDSSRTRIFSWADRAAPLVEVDDLVHPESRQHAQGITSDLPGSRSGGPIGQHHNMDERTGIHEQERINFAREVTARLEKGRTGGEFEALMIVASPSFLGELRKHMANPLRATVVNELDKNIVESDPEDIRSHLVG